MTNQQRIYLIILQRRIVSLEDLTDITNFKRITILRAIAPMILQRKIKAIKNENNRYFHIINKPL